MIYHSNQRFNRSQSHSALQESSLQTNDLLNYKNFLIPSHTIPCDFLLKVRIKYIQIHVTVYKNKSKNQEKCVTFKDIFSKTLGQVTRYYIIIIFWNGILEHKTGI